MLVTFMRQHDFLSMKHTQHIIHLKQLFNPFNFLKVLLLAPFHMYDNNAAMKQI